MKINNTMESYIGMWQKLEETYDEFMCRHRRFCIRRILQSWFPARATDDFIWEVCYMASTTYIRDEKSEDYQILGMDILPTPALTPRRSREFLRALTMVMMGIKNDRVRLRQLDKAYGVVFRGRKI